MPDQPTISTLTASPRRAIVALPLPGRLRRTRALERPVAARRDRWISAAAIVGAFVLWQLASLIAGRTSVTHEHLIPNVADIWNSFDSLANYWKGGLGVKATNVGGHATLAGAVLALISNSLATFARLAIGLLIGITAAGLLAVIIWWSRPLRRVLLLPAQAARMLPLLAMSPLFAIWFGNRESGAVLFVAFACFAITFIVALTAIDAVPGYYAQYARSLGASRLRAYFTAVLPAAVPSLRAGVMLALGFGWSMVIAAEFIGQNTGLGNIVNQAQQFGRTNTLAVLGVFIVIYAWASYKLAARAFDRLVVWAE
jgi:ABC-type nitrate/sulfonate/bicarbonate transport system permease component